MGSSKEYVHFLAAAIWIMPSTGKVEAGYIWCGLWIVKVDQSLIMVSDHDQKKKKKKKS